MEPSSPTHIKTVKEDEDTSSVEKVKEYYDSDSGFEYYTVIHGSPHYTGIALYHESATEKDIVTGEEYIRGTGNTFFDAYKARDDRMLKFVVDNMPKDRKVKVLELGSGRGGLTRFMAKSLNDMGKLEILVAANISERENELNRNLAKEMGIPDEVIRVEFAKFDELPYEAGSFDVVFSNEALYHAFDKTKLFTTIPKLLVKDGLLCFTDIIQTPEATFEQMKDVFARIHIDSMGNQFLYHKLFTQCGLSKVHVDCSPLPILRHYGGVKYQATVAQKKELLDAGVTQEFVDN